MLSDIEPGAERPARAWTGRRAALLAAAAALGFALRMLAATRGSNYDMESFFVTGGLVHDGRNVYASTTRYNYGPVWFHVLHLLFDAAQGDFATFRVLEAGLLGAVDVALFALLIPRLGAAVALLFLFNPISVLITGYHGQFDAAALLLGLLAVLLLEKDAGERPTRRTWGAVALLGASLALKHVLFAFPLWLAVKEKSWSRRLTLLLVPPALFFLSFLPYWSAGGPAIVENVFRYETGRSDLFVRWIVPDALVPLVSSRLVWLAMLAISALVFRKRGALESLLLYTGVLVAASPVIWNQYLAIPTMLVSALPNPFLALYTLAGTAHLLAAADGLHLPVAARLFPGSPEAHYGLLVKLLALGVLWSWAARLPVLARLRARRTPAAPGEPH